MVCHGRQRRRSRREGGQELGGETRREAVSSDERPDTVSKNHSCNEIENIIIQVIYNALSKLLTPDKGSTSRG